MAEGLPVEKEELDRLMEMSAANVDIRVRVTGGGHTSQIYAIRQAIAKSIVCLPSQSPLAVKSPIRWISFEIPAFFCIILTSVIGGILPKICR